MRVPWIENVDSREILELAGAYNEQILNSIIYLQATASAADLSSPRCFDDKMLERFADAIVALEIKPQLCMLVGLDY